MGLLAPREPDFDIAEWRSRPILERIKPIVVDWGQNGFGSPGGVYFFYLFKMIAYILGALFVIAATPGLGPVSDVAAWWTEPIVYQKVIVWTLLFEVLGFGCGSGPLTFRFLPPIGALTYWLRPGTVRLPPWPGTVPGTRGDRRGAVDIVLYVAVIASAVWLLSSPGAVQVGALGNSVGLIDPVRLIPLMVLLPLLGLRDKTIFLAARSEQYWVPLFFFLFSATDIIVALKLLMVAIWWGAATSKLNRHFPFVVSVMISNSPFMRVKRIKRKLFRDYPRDMRPSKLSATAAHLGTVIEFTVPLVLLLSTGGPLTWVALVIMVIFHLHIISTFPLGVPLEWNVYVIFGALFLFGNYAEVGVTSLESPVLMVVVLALLVIGPVLGNVKPHLISFLPAMRYYAGNWATSMWAFRKGSEQKLDQHITKSAATQKAQLTKLYGEEMAELLMQKAVVFRSMHTHGRALLGLLPRAVDDTRDYDVREGEFVAGVVLGWNFGEGHLHHEQLIRAIQRRCGFEEGEVRVILLESQPMQHQRQHYRIVDVATGVIEEGHVDVKDMCERQPWLDGDGTIPVQPLGGRDSEQAAERDRDTERARRE
ncbi:DUF3556 domain-containing protein [Haloechinothrix sp. YIM 98757]|uniref:DUF3556 domain-containing protein n=1 Tax=Haloechinothrix aidingensis TaxID=2752311 RepID=A0A838AB62_9PSEU|nr:DUF3556 domain-containing protein [Haloechinothrix aidingensis]MBA0126490.1 DUF3556 domain-containing protein [Haloechinothrix aidingensis]